MPRTQLLFFLDSASVYLIAAVILVLPFFFLPVTTDALELPKQILLVAITLTLLLLFGLKGIIERKVSFRRSPLDVALTILFSVILVSSIVSPSKSSSLVAGLPMLAVVLFSFLLINTVTDERKERLTVSALLISGALLALFGILQFLKIYILPYPLTQTPAFSLSGSLLTTAIFLVSLIPIGLSYARSYFRKSIEEVWSGLFLGTTILILIGSILVVYQLVTSAKPVLLPQTTGLRTALQPLGLNFQTALVGTGPGTYLFNFTQFKDVALNATELWNIRFNNSSSLFLEFLSTLGTIGAIAFLFLLFKLISSFSRDGARGRSVETMGLMFGVILIGIFSFFLPFAFIPFFLFFVLCSLYCVRLANDGNKRMYDVTISVVALRKGLISLERETDSPVPLPTSPIATDILPYVLFGVYLVTGGLLAFNMYEFILSDITFQQAIAAANANDARGTYDSQNKAIQTFSNRDIYHRIFSQTNLAIASSIAQGARTATGAAALTDENRRNIVTLVEQSIAYGRNAVLLAPLSSTNWESLMSVYRNLIGFAQNAEQFAIVSGQRAIELDPVNPLLRINFGGIYYQLGQFDLAAREFATAINLKPDFANGHYNLGHAFEAKGDEASLRAALSSYLTVRNLVPQESEDFKKIEGEIAALRKRIPGEEPPEATGAGVPQEQEPLKVATPEETLPEQKPPVPVEGPPGATESSEQR